MKTVDLIILGGGCAGLSLGGKLAQTEKPGRNVPSTLIIEQRTQYENDRSWCFWRPTASAPDPLVRKSWNRWDFSREKESTLHHSSQWSYVCIPSDTFYQSRLQDIAASRRIQLQTDARVTRTTSRDGLFQVECGSVQYTARQVIDTRPLPRPEVSRKGLVQAFLGIEIETATPVSNDGVVGIMRNLRQDRFGLAFDYILPFSDRRLLLEATRFSPALPPPSILAQDLEKTIDRTLPNRNFRILRTEKGLIPMSPHAKPPASPPGWVVAGTPGGAVRPSTGYAFRRIQAWAHQCSRTLLETGKAISHPTDSPSQRFMDRLFLAVLRNQPETAPDLFMSMAKNLKPDCFARFLSDQALPSDRIAVIRALPPLPFIRQLHRELLRLPDIAENRHAA